MSYQRIILALVGMVLTHWAGLQHVIDGQQYALIMVTILGAFGATKMAEHWPSGTRSTTGEGTLTDRTAEGAERLKS